MQEGTSVEVVRLMEVGDDHNKSKSLYSVSPFLKSA